MQPQSSLPSSMRLDSLHGDSLIWTNKSIETEENPHSTTLLKSSRSAAHFPKVNSLKPAKDEILSFIKPDYGSLGEFITDINLSADLLKQKKKRYDGQDQAQQKRIRQYLQSRNLNKILCNYQSTSQQRSVACRLLIQRAFEQAFGTSINDFYHQQVQSLQPQQKKNNLNIGSLSDALDQIINQAQTKVELKPNQHLNYMKENMRKNRSYLKDNTQFLNEKESVAKRLNTHKNNYRTLQRIHVPSEPTEEFLSLQEKYKRPIRSLLHNRVDSYSSSASKNGSSMFQNFDGKSFIISDTHVEFVNLYEISTETVMYAISKMNFEALQEFSVVNTSFGNTDLLLLLLDLMALESKKLKVVVVQDIQQVLTVKMREKLSQRMKSVLQTACESLRLLRLNKLDLQTKDFCVLCLGIGSNKRLQTVELKNNKIDETAKKSYDVITKFFKSLEFNLEGNLLQKQIMKDKLKSSKVISK